MAGLLGAAFALLAVQNSLPYLYYGFSDGFMIGTLVAIYSLYVSRTYVLPRLRRTPFLLRVALHSLVYVVIYIIGRYLSYVVQGRSISNLSWDGTFYSALAYTLILAIIANFTFEVSRLLGVNVTIGFIKGTYSTPIEEERLFLFADLVSSTTIAEKLGNKKFLKLLSHFFYDLGLSVIEHDGEIYKYVGDEAIISWKSSGKLAHQRPLHCFFDFVKRIEDRKEHYLKEFGLVPQFRGGMHGGMVIAGELGEAKKEIAYLGDVVNSTARIMDVAKEHKVPLVVSEYVVKRMDLTTSKTFICNPVGQTALRGKSEVLKLYEVRPSNMSTVT